MQFYSFSGENLHRSFQREFNVSKSKSFEEKAVRAAVIYQQSASEAAPHGSNAAEKSPQAQIADELKISQPQVSRLLAHARKEGWLRERIEIVVDEIPGDLQVLVDRNLPSLQEAIQQFGCSASIWSGPNATFHQFAATELLTILRPSRLVGVAWGHNVSKSVAYLDRGAEPTFPVACIPVSGDPVFALAQDKDKHYHSTAIAQNLQSRIGDKEDLPTLSGVPSYIPSRFENKKRDVILEFIHTFPGYESIFGSEKSKYHISKVDTLITGIGTTKSDDPGTFVRERLLQEPKLKDKIPKISIGDIAGVLIAASDKQTRSQKDELERLNKRFVGITIQHIRDIAENARTSNQPGVIVITTSTSRSAEKAQVIRRALEMRLINHLIVPLVIASKLI